MKASKRRGKKLWRRWRQDSRGGQITDYKNFIAEAQRTAQREQQPNRVERHKKICYVGSALLLQLLFSLCCSLRLRGRKCLFVVAVVLSIYFIRLRKLASIFKGDASSLLVRINPCNSVFPAVATLRK